MSVHQIISTDVIYKAIVKKEDAHLRLSQFAEMIQSFNSGDSSIDSVRTYLGLSRNCHEILELIQNFANTSAKDACTLISICTSILVRIANDLKNFHSIAVSLVAEILNFGYKTLHNFLKVSQKPLRMQTTLHLLSAMAAQGPQAARDVFVKMGFASGGFVHLLNKCNQVKDDDVRTSYLNLIVLLLSIGDNNLVRQILETKGFLNGIFPGLPYDRPSVIILVLETFLSKIINNSSVAKTSKIRLFNDYTLKFVINLYDWKGTSVRQQKSLKRKLGEDGDEFRVVEAGEEVITSVHEIAHKFLLEVCCSFKNGIVFRDDNSGTSGRNQNHIITNTLKSLLNPHLHPLKSEFLTSVLKVCPGQIKHYLPTLNDSLSPRLSVPWVRAMELLKKIIKAQDCVSVLFESGEKTAVTKLVLMAKDMMFPEVISVSHFTKSLKDDHPCVCYHLASYVCCSLQYVKQISIYCNNPSKSCVYSFVELQDFYSKFIPVVEKAIPEFKSFQDYWDRLINMKDFDDDANLIANGVEVPSLKAQLSQILDIFKNYHEVFPGTELSNDFYQNIFCGLKRIQKELLDTKDCILQLELLDFIATCRSNKTAINIQNEDFSPMSIAFDLFLAAEDFQIKARITNIILKLLPNIHSLDIRDWEINIWLQYIKTDDSSHQKVLVNFFEEMLKIVAKQDQTWINNIKEDKKPRCSNLVFAALVSLSQDHEYVKLCITYVESVLKNIMFRQAEPNQLFPCIEIVCEKFSESTVSHWKMISYFKECKTKKTKLTHGFIKKPTSCSEALQNIFISFNFNVKNISKAMAHFAELFENIQCSDFEELENLLWQLLLYIDLEVSQIFETTFNDKTNIPFYVSTVKQLISKVDAFNAEETSNGKQYRQCIVENILSHHTMIKCFLLVHDDAILKQNYEDVLTLTHLIFSVLSESSMHNTFSDNEPLLLPFKKKVVAFCETYMVNFDCNSVHSTLFWNIVKTLVTDFSSMFSCENVIILLEKFSSLGHERFQDLDPKLRVLSKVIDIYCESNDFFLLSSECARTLICKYLNCKRKKRATIIKLLKKHPVYSLTLKSDDVHQLVAQQSLVNLELLDILICYNTEIRSYVQNFILTNVGDSEGENEFFLGIIGTVASHNSASSKKSKNVAFLTSVAQDYWKCFCSIILRHIDEDIAHSATNIDCMLSLLETHQLIAKNQIQEVLQILLQESPVSLPSNSKVDILLRTIGRWRRCWPADCVCTVIMNWMKLHFQSRKPLNETLLKFSLDSIRHFDDSVIYEHFKNSSEWHNFIQIALKAAFRKTDCGVSILTLLMCICKKLYISTEEKLETTTKKEGTQVVYTFLTGHSNFFPIMLDGSDQNKQLKGSVISLLTVLVNANASLCKSTHIPLLLASYTSSLSINDRKLLYLLKLYEDAGINMGDFSPFMWGTSAMAHYSINKNVQFSLWKQPKMREILSLFQKDTLYFLTLNFPLDLKLEMEISEQEESECCGKMYDPRFVLHIASVLLSPGAYVNCREFIESGVLGVVFRSLSSDDSSMRALGYYCLSQFYSHLQSVRSKQSQVWIALLDSIRYSIEKPNPRIPSIVTLFLAKAVNILTKPDNRLYSAIYRFLTVKPNLDLSQVPEFYKLFNSTDIEHRIQRSWILSLVGEGLQSSLDFHLCQKLYLFTILLPYYSSPISIESEKVKILQIVLASVKIFSSARTLCQSGLLTWLYSAIKNSESDEIVIISTLNDVMHMLWHTSFGNTIVEPDKDESTISQTCENADNDEQREESYVKKKSTYSSFPSEFLLTHFGLIQKLGSLNTISLLKYLETLLSVLRVQSAHTESPFVRAMSPLTFNHASVLARHWQQFYESQPNSSDKNHKVNDSTTTQANMHQHFSEILMFWMPPWKQFSVEIQTDVVVSLCIDISFLTLKHLSHDTDVIDRFSHWLLKCLNEDITHGLSQSLCSPDFKPSYCAHTILGLYEASSAVRTDKCKSAFLQSSTWAEVCLRLNHSQYIKRQQSILQSFFQKKS